MNIMYVGVQNASLGGLTSRRLVTTADMTPLAFDLDTAFVAESIPTMTLTASLYASSWQFPIYYSDTLNILYYYDITWHTESAAFPVITGTALQYPLITGDVYKLPILNFIANTGGKLTNNNKYTATAWGASPGTNLPCPFSSTGNSAYGYSIGATSLTVTGSVGSLYQYWANTGTDVQVIWDLTLQNIKLQSRIDVLRPSGGLFLAHTRTTTAQSMILRKQCTDSDLSVFGTYSIYSPPNQAVGDPSWNLSVNLTAA